ncbi:MAG: hypothetical protein ACJ8DM_02965, partial [Microvirga sp.]
HDPEKRLPVSEKITLNKAIMHFTNVPGQRPATLGVAAADRSKRSLSDRRLAVALQLRPG